jgi:hypothetical protein
MTERAARVESDMGTCTMCEEAPATTTWGFPVCQPCADALSMLDEDLKKMEAGDPALKVAGERVEAAWAEFQRLRDEPAVEVNRTLRPPARWREAVSKLLWRLHLYRRCGSWDARTDARRISRG